MKKTAMLFMLALFLTVSAAVAQQTADERHWLQVIVESAVIRAEPLPDAARAGSAFEGDSLEAVGRNADGTWWEVRRPGAKQNAGWVFNQVVRETFEPWDVPITSVIGITGDTPVEDTGLSVFVLANAVLRSQPFIDGERLLTIPHSVTIPVVGRNQDGSWLLVNYNGTVGWLSRTVTNASGDIMSAPLGFDLPPLAFEVIIIPPEIQLAQVERLREFARAQRELSSGLATYWQLLLRGEIMPCAPPPFTTFYQRTPQDIQQLPELNRYLPRLDDAIEAINESLEPLQSCGAYPPEIISAARADAINAGLMLDNTLVQLDGVENIIKSQVPRPR